MLFIEVYKNTHWELFEITDGAYAGYYHAEHSITGEILEHKNLRVLKRIINRRLELNEE